MTAPLAGRAALHWAALATRLQTAKTRHGVPLTPTDRATYQRYRDNAHAAGWTTTDITRYQPTT